MRDDETVMLRPYRPADEVAAIALWHRSWQAAYPDIDFAARLAWWEDRWRNALVPSAQIVVAGCADRMVGFVTVEPSGYLDQIVVAPDVWGRGVGGMLLAAARRLSPERLELRVNSDNARAIRFYARHGFVFAAQEINARSGRQVDVMRWSKPV